MNWEKFTWLLLDNADKYFLIAGPIFILFYILLKKKITYKKIQFRFPKFRDYKREILFSTFSIIIFSFPPLFMLYSDSIRPHTTFYEDFAQYGIVYAIVAFPLMLLIHDTYFYWAHRLMHHPKLFKLFHLVHHKSNNPSPWAAYAFHPLEAVVESLIFVVFLFTLPVHSIHLKFFFIFSLLYNVYGHLGFELYPKNFNRHWLGKWMNTSVAHNMHHQHFKGNYGLYFTFWDRLMGTLRNDYDKNFDEITSRSKAPICSLIVIQLIALSANAQVTTDDVVGTWLTGSNEPAKVQIYRSGNEYFGKIVWLKNPITNGKARTDINNPNKNKRDQSIIGLIILKEFKFDGRDEWVNGEIYDPESGKTYRCYLTLKDKHTLKVRGYIGISIFGRTEMWTLDADHHYR